MEFVTLKNIYFVDIAPVADSLDILQGNGTFCDFIALSSRTQKKTQKILHQIVKSLCEIFTKRRNQI